MNKNSRIIPLPVAFIRVPGSYPPKYPGLTLSAPYVICAYLIETPDTTMLFDIGVSADQEGCEWYRPMVLSFDERLSAHGYEVNDIDVIANCHLHCDHAGGNFRFPGVPIYVQSAELAAAGTSGYTVQEACYDFRSAELVHINGRHSLTPDVQLLPTPGHSPGHHSLLVRATPDGNTLLAGQAFDTANEFAAAVLAQHPQGEAADAAYPEWLDDVLTTDIDVVRFAHDLANWRPAPVSYRGAIPLTPWT